MSNFETSEAVATEERPSNSRRAEANRANARLSTGPRTEAGKLASRRNALKHGLTGRTLIPHESEEEARDRREGWIESFRPGNRFEYDLVVHGANTLTLLNKARREQELAQLRSRDRADRSWDAVKDVEAARLAENLSKNPREISLRLQSSAHGARWLIGQWEELGRRLENDREWTPEQRSLALDMLGVDPRFRDDQTTVDRSGASDEELRDHRMRLVIGELEALGQDLERNLLEDDLDARTLAADHLGLENDDDNRLSKRYERSLSNDFHRTLDRLRKLQPGRNRTEEVREAPLPAAFIAEPPPVPPPIPTPTYEPSPPQAPRWAPTAPPRRQIPATMRVMHDLAVGLPGVTPEDRADVMKMVNLGAEHAAKHRVPAVNAALLADLMDPDRRFAWKRGCFIATLLSSPEAPGTEMTPELRREGEELFRKLSGGLTPPTARPFTG